jgi:hypothetical protein
MNIHQLIARISRLGQSQIGHGPKHPELPNIELAEAVKAYFQRYSFLMQDQDYLDFMECYAGLYVFRPEYHIAIDVFGFTEASSDLMRIQNDYFFQGENNILEDGFLAFCDASFVPSGLAPEDITFLSLEGGGFAFSESGERQFGVYRATVSGSESEIVEYKYYCSSFLTWLEILLESQGLFPETVD